jgi:hypothetical protein
VEELGSLQMYFLLLLILQIGTGLAFRYKVTGSPKGTRKCFKSVFAADNVINGKLHVTATDGESDFVVQDTTEDRSTYWAKANIGTGKDYDFKFTNVHWYVPVEFCIVFRSTGSTATVNLNIDVVDSDHPMIGVHEQLTSNEDKLKNAGNVMDSVISGINYLNEKETKMRDLNGILFF